MKKLSFLSGLLAIALIFAPFASVAYAEEALIDESGSEQQSVNVTDDVYDEDTVNEDVYEDDNPAVDEDVYEDENPAVDEDDDSVIDDAYSEDDDYWHDDDYWNDDDWVPSDVYGITGEVVIDDVYLKNSKVTNGTIELDYSDTSDIAMLSAYLNAEGLSSEVKQVVINQGNVKASIPRALLGNGIDFDIVKRNIEGSLLAFEFWLYDWESSEYITDFKDSPITLTFVVDKDKVKNWADLVVYYIDENGEKAEAIDVTYNEKTGEVFVTVTHFSTYALFEEEGRGTAKSVNTQSDQGGEEENTGTVKVVDESGTTGSSGSTDKDGQRLPNTATDHFNLLMMGVIVFGLGGSILLVRYLRLKVTNG